MDFREVILETLQLDEGAAETRTELKRLYNGVFGEGAYAGIRVPENVAKGADVWNGYEKMSAAEYYRFTKARERLANLVGTETHHAKGVIAKVKEYLQKQEE